MNGLRSLLSKSKSESPLEQMFEDQLLEYGIMLDQQFFVGPFRIDFGIIDRKMCFEVDSVAFHGSYEQVQKDNRRQDYIEKKGWKVLRIPSWMIHKQKGLAAGEIALKYFADSLTEKERLRALFVIKRYFGYTDENISRGITMEIDKNNEKL